MQIPTYLNTCISQYLTIRIFEYYLIFECLNMLVFSYVVLFNA